MTTAELKERQAEYRRRGWWPGERLETRYSKTVLARPDALAVADGAGRELTHEDLWRCSGELADLLQDRGVSAGDVVLLFLPNRVEWQIALLGVLRLQAIPASIPTKTDLNTLTYVADLVGCRAMLTSENERGSELLDLAEACQEKVAAKLPVVCVAAEGAHRPLNKIVCEGEAGNSVPHLDHIMFTSSTTGLPKAVMHTADTLAALNFLFTDRFSLAANKPIFMCSPLGHSVGGIHGARLALHTGAALVLQESWDPAQALLLMDQYQCNFTAASTPFLKDLLDEQCRGENRNETSLATFLCGGAPVPPTLLEAAWQAFPNTFVTNLWGMTEGGLVTCVPDSPKHKLVSTAGVGLPGLELQILGDDGGVLDTGCEGELAMRGPGVFIGYFGQDNLYQSLLTRDGFFRTGDLAQIDDEGYVQITGRLKDLIIRGGVNISPLPTEDTLSSHPKLASVAVVGYPDDRMGERICAVVEPYNDAPTLDELISYATGKGLPKRQLPEIIRYVAAMPRTAAGKIRKPALQEMIKRADPSQLQLEPDDAS